jgi:NAD(P)-dependent dehydrogenase (short-subunit alcohol dehydrogenase family)
MLDGRVAVVTGAGRGIGRGCAAALAKAGADVVLVSRTLDELQQAARELEPFGRACRTIVCDVTDATAVGRELGAAAIEQVDILVHAAGGNLPEPFFEVSEDHLDALLALNIKSAFLAAQAVAQTMVDRGEGGAVVFLSSQMGHVGAPNRTLYCATKHAIEGLTKALAVELAPHRIRVNAVAPTFVETQMTSTYLADEGFRRDVLRRIPLGRIGAVDDVTGAVVFLASPAASLITGVSLLVDGGWTAQ